MCEGSRHSAIARHIRNANIYMHACPSVGWIIIHGFYAQKDEESNQVAEDKRIVLQLCSTDFICRLTEQYSRTSKIILNHLDERTVEPQKHK